MKDLDTTAEELRYSIWDPAGNITALVESDVRIEDQPSAAAKIMERHPEVEQVGFVRFSPESPEFQVQLRMAGGEFCGNTSLCRAAFYDMECSRIPVGGLLQVRLRVSGTAELTDVSLTKTGKDQYSGTILMPPALGAAESEFRYAGAAGMLPWL